MLLYLILIIRSLNNNSLIIKFNIIDFYASLNYFKDYIFSYNLY